MIDELREMANKQNEQTIHSDFPDRDWVLRPPLWANALFSGLCGTAMALWSTEVIKLTATGPEVAYQVVGLGLILFASTVAIIALRPTPLLVLTVVVADIIWIGGTLLGAALLASSVSITGWAMLAGVNGTVGILAYLQYRSIITYYSAPAGCDEQFRLCLQTRVDVPPETFWPVLSNLAAIQTYMPSLRFSTLTDGDVPGEGCVRTCENLKGGRWSERCDRWIEGVGFEMTFLTEAEGFPYPFSRMRGGWNLSPAGTGSTVQVWWRVTSRNRRGAGILLPLMQASLAKGMALVVANMANAASPEVAHVHRQWLRRSGTMLPC
ncbi:SRPBCC family protein [Devosia sp. CAU 1758]